MSFAKKMTEGSRLIVCVFNKRNLVSGLYPKKDLEATCNKFPPLELPLPDGIVIFHL
jgi:hypothetical protein